MRILIADKFEQAGVERLRGLRCEVLVEPELKGADLTARVAESGCEVLVVRSTKVARETLEAGTDLRLVIRAGSGYDTIDVEAASERNIRVCNCPGMNAVAVAELTLGLMIALDRQIVDETADLRRGVWNKKGYSQSRGLKGRTLGIVGMGRIGREVARRAAAFEMKLVYYDVIPRIEVERDFGARRVSFNELLAGADFVTLHVPGGDVTDHLIGTNELERMKPTTFLINCSRGGIVDEKALAAALNGGRLAGAALDVYEIEPAATERIFRDPIPAAAHMYGTHHVGASTQQAQLAVAEETVRIIETYMTAREFPHCVNPPAATPTA